MSDVAPDCLLFRRSYGRLAGRGLEVGSYAFGRLNLISELLGFRISHRLYKLTVGRLINATNE